MEKLTIIDPFTLKTISYKAGDFFLISVRRGSGKEKTHSTFNHKDLPEALKFFHNNPIEKGAKKYLYRLDSKIKEKIYSISGMADTSNLINSPFKKVKLKVGRKKESRITCDIRITSLPKSIHDGLNGLEFLNYDLPEYGGKCDLIRYLLGEFLSLSEKDRKERINKAKIIVNGDDAIETIDFN